MDLYQVYGIPVIEQKRLLCSVRSGPPAAMTRGPGMDHVAISGHSSEEVGVGAGGTRLYPGERIQCLAPKLLAVRSWEILAHDLCMKQPDEMTCP